ncbi:uncharacterized protein LOC143831604 isoform X2 [Paroedura picta]|uniref:uncharacterized protein LOC143831604 isoform X2 n=1 Tax=Paroedura picta TaxID=143630 RepID=UPI004057847F
MKEHLEKIKMERDVVVKEFDQLHQFEQEQKSFLLDQLKELQKEVEEEQKSKAENADNLDALIRDMEAICHQSDHDFLQDINNTLTRYMAPSATSCQVMTANEMVQEFPDACEHFPSYTKTYYIFSEECCSKRDTDQFERNIHLYAEEL